MTLSPSYGQSLLRLVVLRKWTRFVRITFMEAVYVLQLVHIFGWLPVGSIVPYLLDQVLQFPSSEHPRVQYLFHRPFVMDMKTRTMSLAHGRVMNTTFEPLKGNTDTRPRACVNNTTEVD